MGVVPGVSGSNSVRLRSYRYEKIPRGALAEESVLEARRQVFKNPNFRMQKLGSNDVRLRSYGSIFEALDELYPMGVVLGLFGQIASV